MAVPLSSEIASVEKNILRVPSLRECGKTPVSYGVQLPQLDEAARSNATDRAYPSQTPLAALVEAQVERTPNAVAVVCGEQKLTYRELNEQANQLARELNTHGAGPDRLVGLFVERSTDLIVALLAIVKAGAAYLPLDPLFPSERIRTMLDDSGVRIMVAGQSFASKLSAFEGKTIRLEDTRWKANGRSNLAIAVGPEDLAYVLFTSGSTGRPKGVQVPRRALTNLLWSLREWLGLNERDRVLAISTIAFDIASLEIWLPLVVGAEIVVAGRDAAMDPGALMDLLERHDITFLQATPVTWRLLFETGWHGKPDLQAVSGGEVMPPELAAQLVPAVKVLWNLYGPTETTIYSTGCRVMDGRAPISIGRPLANTQCYILDAQGKPVAIGEIGELYIGGDGLARGYVNRPELTAEKFIPDPFRGGQARMYRSGDLVRHRQNGNIEWLGRIDQQIKVRGYRVELGEIEAALKDQPEIKQAIVIAREDARGDKQLTAYLVASACGAPDPDELRERLKQRLPDYMLPSAFVFLEKLPVSLNGKIDRSALPLPRAIPSVTEKQEHAPSRTQLERKLAGLWSELLHRKDVGIRENFFDMGGHSLSAMRVAAWIRSELELDMPVFVLFENPTVESLAKAIEGLRVSMHSEEDLLRMLDEIEAMPPSYAEG
jgi:amino acid adenylation domain-containing protein